MTSIKTNIGRTDFHYDTQGNLREQRGIEKKQYFYDTLNRLSTVKTNEFLQKNRYDAERLRHEVEENGVVHRFIFDNGELSAEETKDSKVCYLYGNERVIASKVKGAETSYHIQDEAGSTLFLLDETHKIQKTYHYDAFGMVLEESGDTLNRLTYTGQQYDIATGQYYLRARFYNPALARFLQEDVYRGDGLNLYAYCKNHPVKYYDPSGYMCEYNDTKTSAGKQNDSIFTNKDMILNALKDAPVEYRKNPNTGIMEPYMKQVQITDDYKVILRRDIGDFNHGDLDHWNFEIQTVQGGNLKYDIHLYLGEDGNLLPFTEKEIYIPKKSPFH